MPLWILYSALPVGLALLLIVAVNGTIGDIRTLVNRKGEEE
jgi:hypothetical protein